MYEESGRGLSGSVCPFCAGAGAVQADAVTTWNENAAKAATAAWSHQRQRPGRIPMYAMVHAAVHDAVNAIDRRSRPYAFDATVERSRSMDAAVAAAARDVLVSVIATMPELPACIANGIANANASYTTALAAIPSGPAKTNGVRWVRPPRPPSSRCGSATDRMRRGWIRIIRRGPSR